MARCALNKASLFWQTVGAERELLAKFVTTGAARPLAPTASNPKQLGWPSAHNK